MLWIIFKPRCHLSRSEKNCFYSYKSGCGGRVVENSNLRNKWFVKGHYRSDTAKRNCSVRYNFANFLDLRTFPGYFTGISRTFCGYFPDILRIFPGHFAVISRMFSGHFLRKKLRTFSGHFSALSRMFPGHFPDIFY